MTDKPDSIDQILLLDEKPKSCFWSHDWSNWEVTEQGTITNVATNAKIGKYIYQQRQCQRCNKTELDKIEVR